ncbi:hypothetical protein TNCV_2038541 [Trichonephila clavipes]|nr:hypothetical protein TNCV_2038541 [Trichonephila clavipes]
MKMRVLSRSRQNDRLRVMLVLVHISITPPHLLTVKHGGGSVMLWAAVSGFSGRPIVTQKEGSPGKK